MKQKQLHSACVCSKLELSGLDWHPWQSNTNILKAEQNKVLCIVTGQVNINPAEAHRFETGIPSYETHLQRSTLKYIGVAKIHLGADLSRKYIPSEALKIPNLTKYFISVL